ncbi:hypothetical protein Q4Q34_00830 [Flavivirga abyssicola]|uniref:hypothetical protein n=1 Tax=Flavivirga abyssicola TaxID=3063533 RepID=UPI0026DEE6E8|nr:hypothetical protein [Flavivirga sp. MEBiC07777]WVK13581.1 hypothetical protein Q4Q34_00830 [Flavivirga sp. MEBiC07777]
MLSNQIITNSIRIIHTLFDDLKSIPINNKNFKEHGGKRYTSHEINHVFNETELVGLHVCIKSNVKRRTKFI